jgi:hypothetical protein
VPVTYTNRKGTTYHLYRGQTKTGKPRYYFGRAVQGAGHAGPGEPVEDLPPGFAIRESVNGVVSLARDRPSRLRPAEVAAVEAAVRRHRQGHRYRVAVTPERIDIYERVGPDLTDLLADLGLANVKRPEQVEQLRAEDERHTQYTPVLRFILADPDRRIFRVERMCYLSRIDGWLELGQRGPVATLARALIPTLGTDRFFELW